MYKIKCSSHLASKNYNHKTCDCLTDNSKVKLTLGGQSLYIAGHRLCYSILPIVHSAVCVGPRPQGPRPQQIPIFSWTRILYRPFLYSLRFSSWPLTKLPSNQISYISFTTASKPSFCRAAFDPGSKDRATFEAVPIINHGMSMLSTNQPIHVTRAQFSGVDRKISRRLNSCSLQTPQLQKL